MSERWKDLSGRLKVLGALTLTVFVPICVWPSFCVLLFYCAVAIASVEWLGAIRHMSKKSVMKLIVSFLMLLFWSVPTFLRISTRILECPGHRLSMECIAIVLLVSDSAQLFCGRLVGRTKALPAISPNKSVEGYIGGLLLTLLYGTIVHGWDISSLVVVYVAGCVGDLYFSTAKRVMGVKDFSKALGPHGGFCDRIDSYVFAWAALEIFQC